MNCKVCGSVIEDGADFCPVCGASIESFANVQPSKIIYNQSPSVQNYVGDDSVTQLIPQNYGAAQGDDSVTQLIPQNYGATQGDDSVTQLITESNQYTQPPYNNNTANNMSYPTETKKGISGGLVAGIIAGVVVAIVVIVLIVAL